MSKNNHRIFYGVSDKFLRIKADTTFYDVQFVKPPSVAHFISVVFFSGLVGGISGFLLTLLLGAL